MTLRPSVPDRDLQVEQRLLEGLVRVDQVELVGLGLDPRVREQVLDHLLHLLRAVDDEVDVPVGPLVDLALVPPLQELGEARDRPERLLQVVRGDVRELLELLVRPRELPAPLLERGRRRLVLGDLPLQAAVRLDQVGGPLLDPVVELVVGRHQRLLGALPLGHVAGGGEDAGDPARLVAVDGRVVQHGGDPAVAVADLELVVRDRAVAEDRLVPGLRLRRAR